MPYFVLYMNNTVVLEVMTIFCSFPIEIQPLSFTDVGMSTLIAKHFVDGGFHQRRLMVHLFCPSLNETNKAFFFGRVTDNNETYTIESQNKLSPFITILFAAELKLCSLS